MKRAVGMEGPERDGKNLIVSNMGEASRFKLSGMLLGMGEMVNSQQNQRIGEVQYSLKVLIIPISWLPAAKEQNKLQWALATRALTLSGCQRLITCGQPLGYAAGLVLAFFFIIIIISPICPRQTLNTQHRSRTR